MPKEFAVGCKRPEIKKNEPVENEVLEEKVEKKEELSMIKVGKPAPEFTAPGFYDGKFVETKISEYKGKWLVLCFYPGDFTFV